MLPSDFWFLSPLPIPPFLPSSLSSFLPPHTFDNEFCNVKVYIEVYGRNILIQPKEDQPIFCHVLFISSPPIFSTTNPPVAIIRFYVWLPPLTPTCQIGKFMWNFE